MFVFMCVCVCVCVRGGRERARSYYIWRDEGLHKKNPASRSCLSFAEVCTIIPLNLMLGS